MHILTAVLVVLKLTSTIAVSWLIVFLPSIIAVAVAVLVTLAAVCLGIAALKKFK